MVLPPAPEEQAEAGGHLTATHVNRACQAAPEDVTPLASTKPACKFSRLRSLSVWGLETSLSLSNPPRYGTEGQKSPSRQRSSWARGCRQRAGAAERPSLRHGGSWTTLPPGPARAAWAGRCRVTRVCVREPTVPGDTAAEKRVQRSSALWLCRELRAAPRCQSKCSE